MSRLQLLTIYAVQLTRGAHTYRVHWTDETRKEARRQLGRWASDPDMNFNWYDAAVLSQEMRKVDPENY